MQQQTSSSTTRVVEETSSYRSGIGPRRTNISHGPSGATSVSSSYSYSSAMVSMPPSKAVSELRETRENEKRQLTELNDRFAAYIERVRFLEAVNKKLQLELEGLKSKWGMDTSKIKVMFEAELNEARRLIDESAKDKAAAELRASRFQEESLDWRRKYDELLTQRQQDRTRILELQKLLSTNEAELNLLRRQVEDLDREMRRYRDESQRLLSELQKAKLDLDGETLARADVENRLQTLHEELEFLKQVHEQEINELMNLVNRDLSVDASQFFRHELQQAVKDIRDEYAALGQAQKIELESWYRSKVQEVMRPVNTGPVIREDTSKLREAVHESKKESSLLKTKVVELESRVRELTEQLEHDRREWDFLLSQRSSQNDELRSQLGTLLRDYEELIHIKTTLEFEIATYRKLLESEERRTFVDGSTDQRPQVPNRKPDERPQPPVTREPATTRINTFDMSAKYIVLENTSKTKDQSLDGWLIARKPDVGGEIVYRLPKDFVLKAGKSVKIWARGQGRANPPAELVNDASDTWGVGSNVVTRLVNKDSEVVDKHTGKTGAGAPLTAGPTDGKPQARKAPRGTVFPFPGFNAEADCTILRKAMKGIGTDEKAIIAVVGSRSNMQRQEIRNQFQTMYKKDLIRELESETSGNFRTTLVALFSPATYYDASCLYNATKGAGTNEAALIEILFTRTNQEIREISKMYKAEFHSDLEKDIADDTSGHFKRLLISASQAKRTELTDAQWQRVATNGSEGVVDRARAQQDAQALLKEGEAKWATTESCFNEIVAGRNQFQLRATFEEYAKMAGKDIETAIEGKHKGDIKDGLLAIVKVAQGRRLYLAERLYRSMKGVGTDEATLIRIVVSRSEVDLADIKECYAEKYNTTLAAAVESDTSGDFKKILLAIIGRD